jgi:hypothetical protein
MYFFLKNGLVCLSIWTRRFIIVLKFSKYEPRHDKTNIVGLRPAWIQTSLRRANSMDPDKTARMLCWFCREAAHMYTN